MGIRVESTPGRAVRFPVHLPVRYRVPDTGEWIEARTENVSRTGVLIGTDYLFEPSTHVDVRLEVPATKVKEGHAEVICKGTVVRVEPMGTKRISSAVALEFENYRLTHKQNSRSGSASHRRKSK